jgi:hypothetical protein
MIVLVSLHLILEEGGNIEFNNIETRKYDNYGTTGDDAKNKFTPSLGIPYLGVWTPR